MNYINGIQSALDYIEEHLTDDIDYEEIAQYCYCSSYHFQRIFSILCGYTLGEYIRNRRLTLAGIELQAKKTKVMDIALKYGYETPDSFTKAFRSFHGILPSQARRGGTLKFFSRRTIKVTLEGAIIENYRIEYKPKIILAGYKRRFTGDISERFEQEGNFFVTTRRFQNILKELADDQDTQYAVYTNFNDNGYDCYIASKFDNCENECLNRVLDEEKDIRFEKVVLSEGLYLVCETEKCQYPTMLFSSLREEVISSFLPQSDYQIRNAPEVSIYHWHYRKDDAAYNSTRYIELWLPIEKR